MLNLQIQNPLKNQSSNLRAVKPKGEFSLDRNLDFETTYDQLKLGLEYFKNRPKPLTYTAILLCQLRNGSRVSEAYDAIRQFKESGICTQEVIVRKQIKKTASGNITKPSLRKMIIPDEIRPIKHMLLDSIRIETLEVWAPRTFGWNTHSLRYCFIQHLVFDKGTNLPIVAQITKHRNFNILLKYTQSKQANQVLDSLV
jgi:hypothetical protein